MTPPPPPPSVINLYNLITSTERNCMLVTEVSHSSRNPATLSYWATGRLGSSPTLVTNRNIFLISFTELKVHLTPKCFIRLNKFTYNLKRYGKESFGFGWMLDFLCPSKVSKIVPSFCLYYTSRFRHCWSCVMQDAYHIWTYSCSPPVSCSTVVRASDWCAEGHGFDSRRGLTVPRSWQTETSFSRTYKFRLLVVPIFHKERRTTRQKCGKEKHFGVKFDHVSTDKKKMFIY